LMVPSRAEMRVAQSRTTASEVTSPRAIFVAISTADSSLSAGLARTRVSAALMAQTYYEARRCRRQRRLPRPLGRGSAQAHAAMPRLLAIALSVLTRFAG